MNSAIKKSKTKIPKKPFLGRQFLNLGGRNQITNGSRIAGLFRSLSFEAKKEKARCAEVNLPVEIGMRLR
ncbi:hypothetical protein [Candidatus Coxiella mudrowiae]|uniref:hypothetical protein n=1 Tax=Candidatus Coxiella mudrowiae TaxID=2054173 RepID=UPI000C292120|nr:hypothetical protein [Candidatus Coxiella mudrowiae]